MKHISLSILILFSIIQRASGQEDKNPYLSHLDSFQLHDNTKILQFRDYLNKHKKDLLPQQIIEYGLKGAEASEKMGNDSLSLVFNFSFVIGTYSTYLFDSEKSNEVLDSIKEKVNGLNSNFLSAIWYISKGTNYQIEQDFTNALGNYTTALEYLRKENLHSKVCGIYHNISNIYSIIGDKENAIKYAKEALNLSPQLAHTIRFTNSAAAYHRISFNYDQLSETDSAFHYLLLSIQAMNQVEDFRSDPNGLQIYCDIYLRALTEGKRLKGFFNTDSIINEIKICKNFKEPIYSLSLIEYYYSNEKYDKVDELLADSSLYNLHPGADKELILFKSKREAKKGNFQKAYELREQYSDREMEIMKEEKRVYSAYFDAQYESAKKEEQLKLLNERNKREELKSRILLFGLLLALLLMVAGIYLYFKLKENRALIQQQAEKLRGIDKQKSKLFTNIAHELRTPLSLIINPINKIIKKKSLSEQEKEQLTLAKNSSEQLITLSDQIIELNKKTTIGDINVRLSNFKWNDFLSNILPKYSAIAKNRDLKLNVVNTINDEVFIQSDYTKLKTVINNLLQNAVKYNREGGSINFSIRADGDYIYLDVEDTGKGIHPEDLPNILDRYYQSKINTSPEGGFGIGLAICKEYLDALNSSINIESEFNQGTKVSLKIPKIINDELETDILEIEKNVISTLEVNNNESTISNHLLIVEDNIDLKRFLKMSFIDEYDLSFAHNGIKALEMLETFTPSLIITDWMMPNMNGLEFIENLRKNPEWAKIPVIMLTARSLQVDQFNAFRKGINDYILKPFDIDFLRSRIEELLSFAEKRTEAISLSESVNQNGSEFIESDIEWLSQIEMVIKKNIGNFDLKIENISEELEISNTHLNRKLKSLVGMSTMQFIDEIRYWEARRLLEEKEITSVKMAAYTIGLKSVKNFSRNFKTRFGFSPSEILRKEVK